jgi:hypothetical protein
MNIFSSPQFLETVADIGFPGRPRAIETVRVGTHRFRLLVVDGRRVVTRWPFLDFVEPLPEDEPGLPTRTLGYLPLASVLTQPAQGWKPEEHGPGVEPSPFVDWTRFARWEDFVALVQGRIGNLFPDSRRKRRKLERDVGPIRFLFHDERPEVLDTCVRWKSAQYIATGLRNMFADGRNVELFRRLAAAGLVRVSSLHAGDRLVAVHLGALHERRCYWWVPAYDPELGRYSPGRLMLEDLLEHSYRSGHAEWDFLIGNEDYKWHYATGNRVVAPLGTPPLSLRAGRLAKSGIKSVLQRSPWLWERAQALKRRLRR